MDGRLLIVDESGDVAIATAGEEGLNVHARAELLTENAWTAPTLIRTTLHVRDRENVAAFDLGESELELSRRTGRSERRRGPVPPARGRRGARSS